MATTKIITGVTDLNAANSTNGLKMPSGGAYSGTPSSGMMRNNTSGASQGSASTMQHYNGTQWKDFENVYIPPPPLTVDYLVVAGGGGSSQGGGGGGGLRTSYGTTQGGGQPSESTLSLTTGTSYSVEVGQGGSSRILAAGNGFQGTSSIFDTITSIGGGGGGNINASANSGGSGGGAGGTSVGTTAGGAAVTSPVVHGYSGGNGGGYGNNQPAAGGGGAGAVGGNTVSSTVAGAGAVGLAVNILNTTNATTASVGEVSGSDVYFSGGGGGGHWTSTGTGAGGLGGGGNGNLTAGGNGFPGSPNTGGGAGGSGASASVAYDGGSGVVILRYPNAYSITTSGSLTESSGSPFTEGTDKVSVFTGGTGTVTFS